MAAARQFIFTPAMKDKKPVAVWITLPFKFKLADKEGGTGQQRRERRRGRIAARSSCRRWN